MVTKDSLLRESLKNAELAVQTTARELFTQLDEDVLVEFSGSALPFRDLKITAKHWALVRGSDSFIDGGGAFQGGGPELIRPALSSETLRLQGGGTLLVKSIPVPKLRSEPFAELPAAVQSAVREKCPGGTYLRSKRGVVGTQLAYEIEVLTKNKLADVYIREDGRFGGGESKVLPESCPAEYLAKLLGASPSNSPADVEWRAFDSQLIAVLTWKHESEEPTVLAVNRYGERFTTSPDGGLSGPTPESAIRLIVGVDVTGVPA